MLSPKWILTWVLAAAEKRPLLGIVALLLVGMVTVTPFIGLVYRDRIGELKEQIAQQRNDNQLKDAQIIFLRDRKQKDDSVYREQVLYLERRYSDTMSAFMARVNQEQADQIQQYRTIERQRSHIVDRNRKMIEKNETIKKILDNDVQK